MLEVRGFCLPPCLLVSPEGAWPARAISLALCSGFWRKRFKGGLSISRRLWVWHGDVGCAGGCVSLEPPGRGARFGTAAG